MRNPEDLGSGLLFITVGALGVLGSRGYEIGEARDMGPGYLPMALFTLLLALGVVIALRGVLSGTSAIPALGLRPFAFVIAAVSAFAALIATAGLVLATLVMVPLASFADREARWGEAVLAAIALAAFAAGVFVIGLGVPAKLWPW